MSYAMRSQKNAQTTGKPRTLAKAAPPIVHEVLNSSNQPLDESARSFFAPRFGHDFKNVRVHTDAEAAQSAQALGASAYTVGSHLVFGPGRYQPGTAEGNQLLAHELAHVVQQRGHDRVPDHLPVGPHNHPLEAEADTAGSRLGNRQIQGESSSPVVQRQPQANPVGATQAQSTPTPGFSVNQAGYMKLVSDAVQQMQGRRIDSQTLAPTIKPVLDSLLGHETWADAAGKQQGGGAVQQQFPGMSPSAVSIRLVMDDSSNSVKLGDFTPTGAAGTIRIFVQKNKDIDTLTETLFHESLHMMTWLANRSAPPAFAQSNNPQVRALRRARKGPEVQLVRNVLDNLASDINPKRQKQQQSPVSPAGLDRTASFLVEEITVRVETAVFEQISSGVAIGPITSATPGGRTLSSQIDANTIDKYLFDFSGDFKPADRSLLDPSDQQYLDAITEILISYANHQIRIRTAGPGVQTTVPRQQMRMPLPPLNP
jgi:hypothetical protein